MLLLLPFFLPPLSSSLLLLLLLTLLPPLPLLDDDSYDCDARHFPPPPLPSCQENVAKRYRARMESLCFYMFEGGTAVQFFSVALSGNFP